MTKPQQHKARKLILKHFLTQQGTLAELFMKVHNILMEEVQQATNNDKDEFWNHLLASVKGKNRPDQQVQERSSERQPLECQPSERQPSERITQSEVKQYEGEPSDVKQYDGSRIEPAERKTLSLD